jgi:hypothetical protein
MKARMGAIGVAIALLASNPGVAGAQTAQAGQLRVEVRDFIGDALVGAAVTLTSQDLGFGRTGVTDQTGKQTFSLLPLGRYTVTIKLTNFETLSLVNNVVEAGKTTNLAVTLQLAAVSESATVIGEVPIVDPGSQTLQTRLRASEFDRMPYARSFLTLLGQAPGLVGTGNANAHGALRSNNRFFIDGVDITDAAAGTFAGDIHFESIQELVVRTSALSAEFGRGSGATIDIITKSGSNRYDGSYRFLATNDYWNADNTTKSQVAPFASLARTRFDKVMPVSSWSMSGPILRDRIWFYVAMQDLRETSPERQTNAAPGFTPENFQQTKRSPYSAFRINAQLAPGHSVWAKYDDAPTRDLVMDYFGSGAEREALTSQSQGGAQLAGQYTGVFGTHWAAEAVVASVTNRIEAVPFEASSLMGGAPFMNITDGRAYNGGAIIGQVKRPRLQANAALSYFTNLGGQSHEFRFGADLQRLRSESLFQFPGGSLFLVESFNPETRQFTPFIRQDFFGAAPSVSTGEDLGVYVRDKFTVGRRVRIDAGLRLEHQTAKSDIGEATVRALSLAPRVSASYALTPDAKTLAVASYGRYLDGVLLQYSDVFAGVPQQTNFDNHVWDPASGQYVFTGRSEQGPATFHPNLDVTPRRLDEITFGIDQQLSQTFGASLRVIRRDWSNFVDDVRSFDAEGALTRTVVNLPEAARSYRALELMFDRRWAGRWAGSASYTFSRTRGNHFADDFTPLGDHLNANCQQNADAGLGDANGVFPCRAIQANLTGRPPFDRPHLIKFNGAYTQPLGKVDLTAGFVGLLASKTTFSKQRTVNVLLPGTNTPSGETLVYFYEPRGSERVSGLARTVDLSVEGAFRPARAMRVGLRAEVFNMLNTQSQIDVNNTAFCASTSSPACLAAVETFGTATSRGSFLGPRTYRLSVVVRYAMQ